MNRDYYWGILLIVAALLTPLLCKESCLVGDFEDVQSWAMNDGSLNPSIANFTFTIDLSGRPEQLAELRLLLNSLDNNNRVQDELVRDDKPTELSADVLHANQSDFESDIDIALNKIIFLSLARNYLERIPLFYTNSQGITGSNWDTLKYLSLYGNNFKDDPSKAISSSDQYSIVLNASHSEEINPKHYFSYSYDKANWVEDLSNLNFPNLLELDLRNCSIQVLSDGAFKMMPNLRRLYLSDNSISTINALAFDSLANLVHLDISRNSVSIPSNKDTSRIDGITIMDEAFKPLTNLKSLDFSYSKIVATCATVFKQLNAMTERLSLCYTSFPKITREMFADTSIKHLDISGNSALEALDLNAFSGIEDTLEIMYANHLPIKEMKPFRNLAKLKVLSLADNNIGSVQHNDLALLKDLQILDLSSNRIMNWDKSVVGDLNNLKLLRLEKNNLNLLSPAMFKDFKALSYLSLGNNTYVCNCVARDFIDRASYIDTNILQNSYPDWITNETETRSLDYLPDVDDEEFYLNLSINIDFHNAYIYYSKLIYTRNTTISTNTTNTPDDDNGECNISNIRKFEDPDGLLDPNDICFIQNFTFRLLDDIDGDYMCTDSRSAESHSFFEADNCSKKKDSSHQSGMKTSTLLVIVLLVLAVVILIVFFIVWKWWSLRYFFVMLKNIAILSILGKDNSSEDADKLFIYDVFVSYCDEDRSWILDELLPEIDNHPNISACLHERDFQVGLSILENIISCMDRSRVLLMIVSQQFLLSQWCQFEMHLAQHRLLETRREQLFLVLLEEIPRRKRPNTLHYLMMTKTYIVWPKDPKDKPLFWKRLKRAILHKPMDKSSVV
ncbi:toll-like receptor 9 [Arctopsyche grandis]|uniref:toll-like receptor 9 n=1 Tax=Arctopsyche grandis TaxID=121162 RepID=UPI00406D9B93